MLLIYLVVLFCCAVVDCGFLPAPSRGQIFITTTTFDSTVIYTCNSGFELQGPNSRTCQANGLWSEFEPQCVGKLGVFLLSLSLPRSLFHLSLSLSLLTLSLSLFLSHALSLPSPPLTLFIQQTSPSPSDRDLSTPLQSLQRASLHLRADSWLHS